MGGNSWTTKEERAYLEINVSQYEAAQAQKRTTLWFDQFSTLFLTKFPEYSNGTNDTPLSTVRKVSNSSMNAYDVGTDHSHDFFAAPQSVVQ